MSVTTEKKNILVMVPCKVDVEAELMGPLALHPKLVRTGGHGYKLSAESYTITHVTTGYAICDGTEAYCRKCAEELASLDWNFDKPGGASQETQIKARQILGKYASIGRER